MSDEIPEQVLEVIEIVCEAGHRQTLRVHGFSRQSAENLAGLMDGTSPMYIHKPGTDSVIGKCGLCGRQLKATVLNRG